MVCLQKEILLQEPQEQEAAVRREVAYYQAVDHPNVVKLLAHELRLHQGHLRAYLVFPYYQVSCGDRGGCGWHACTCGPGRRKAPWKTRLQPPLTAVIPFPRQ